VHLLEGWREIHPPGRGGREEKKERDTFGNRDKTYWNGWARSKEKKGSAPELFPLRWSRSRGGEGEEGEAVRIHHASLKVWGKEEKGEKKSATVMKGFLSFPQGEEGALFLLPTPRKLNIFRARKGKEKGKEGGEEALPPIIL